VADFHLDQSVPSGAAVELRRQGHRVTTARDLNMHEAADAEHLLHAAEHRRILVSRDLDFLELQTAWHQWPPFWQAPARPAHAGIVLVSSNWRAVQAAQEIVQFLGQGWPLDDMLYWLDGARLCHHDGMRLWEHAGGKWVPAKA
jgi:hypothetical protein